jgi:DMSO/TMAO reductase YedYZ molybdopterin-dependent catalytic subunit
MANRGFRRKHSTGAPDRTPPGQYVTDDFPILSAGPTPRVSLASWTFALQVAAGTDLHRWTLDEVRSLPASEVTVDIHCVTKWSKLGTRWKGISFDTLLRDVALDPPTPYVMAVCDGGYTTNLSVVDLRAEGALIAFEYDGAPLDPEHGGPARLVVPHLYFWKSAKWVRALRFMETDQPGFWESHGYHMRGDPWKEQRYTGD